MLDAAESLTDKRSLIIRRAEILGRSEPNPAEWEERKSGVHATAVRTHSGYKNAPELGRF
jgi:hypothetical protein